MKKPKIVNGNSFWLRLEIEKIQFEGGIKNITPYQLASAKFLEVYVVSSLNRFGLKYAIDENRLTLVGRYNLRPGHYGIEIKVIDAHNNNLRYYGADLFQVVNETKEADMPDGIEFGYNVYNLGVLGIYQGVHDSYFDRLEEVISRAWLNEQRREQKFNETIERCDEAVERCDEATAAAWDKQTIVNIGIEVENCILTIATSEFSNISFEAKDEAILQINY